MAKILVPVRLTGSADPDVARAVEGSPVAKDDRVAFVDYDGGPERSGTVVIGFRNQEALDSFLDEHGAGNAAELGLAVPDGVAAEQPTPILNGSPYERQL